MLIYNARLITWNLPNAILENQALLISNGKIAAIGPTSLMELHYPEVERMDARGQYVMPGNINAHSHFYSAFACGINVPGEAPISLPTILQKLWWPFDKALRSEDVRYSALVGIIDAIKHGTTTLFDHHSSPNCIDGILDIIAEAVDQGGIRSVLCFEVTDRDGPERASKGINENARFIHRCCQQPIADGRVAANFGIHAPMTVSERTLEKSRETVSQGTGFHIHVAEHEYDQVRSQAIAGTRSVDRLYRHEILGDKTILAHAIHLDALEIQLIADTNSWISHQPRNNMNSADGVATIESYIRSGARTCLGNDGLSATMWKEAEAATFLQRITFRDNRRMPGDQLLKMAIYNNACLASEYFPDARVGVIEQGAYADLIFLDYHPSTPMTIDNLPSHMVFGFNESMITTTIVNGKVLMKDRVLQELDEEEIKAKSRELAFDFWRRYEELVPSDHVFG